MVDVASGAEPPERVRTVAGRPRKVTAEKLREITSLRASGAAWPEIAQRLGLKAETCRRAAWAAKRARGGVGNSPDPVNNPAEGA